MTNENKNHRALEEPTEQTRHKTLKRYQINFLSMYCDRENYYGLIKFSSSKANR